MAHYAKLGLLAEDDFHSRAGLAARSRDSPDNFGRSKSFGRAAELPSLNESSAWSEVLQNRHPDQTIHEGAVCYTPGIGGSTGISIRNKSTTLSAPTSTVTFLWPDEYLEIVDLLRWLIFPVISVRPEHRRGRCRFGEGAVAPYSSSLPVSSCRSVCDLSPCPLLQQTDHVFSFAR